MKRWNTKLLCLLGNLAVFAVFSGCLTPAGSPTTTSPEGPVAAIPSPYSSATKEDPPSLEEPPPTEVEERKGETEKSPTWMAPTDGFIGCVEFLWAAAHVSLEDGIPMTAEDLKVKLKVKNPQTGEEETLEDHSLGVEIQVSLPEDFLEDLGDALRRGTLRRIGEDSVSEEDTGPTSLKVSLKISSKRPKDPSVRDACAPERAYMRSKIFVLEGDYRRRFIPYSGHEDFQLAPEETFTGLDKLILSRPRLYVPDGTVLKGRLSR